MIIINKKEMRDLILNGISSEELNEKYDYSGITDMSYMFCGGPECSDYDDMFRGFESLTEVPLFDTSNVTNMCGMFNDCASLTEVPLLNTINVTDMSGMFVDCSSLIEVPLFDTTNVTCMAEMFYGCTSLKIVPNFSISTTPDMTSMFAWCTSLESVEFDLSHAEGQMLMFHNCTSLK